MTTTLETMERIAQYAETLPSDYVRTDLFCPLINYFSQSSIDGAKRDIVEFYGASDKSPAWLQIIANAQPGKLEQACAEARAHLAVEIDAMEVNNDNPIVTPTA